MDHKAHRSDHHLLHAHIKELKAELDFERRMRIKVESLNKDLARELADERRQARATAEMLCKELQEEVDRVVSGIEEERRMLQIAEKWREERIQIKLAEARQVMEEKLLQAAAMSASSSSSSRQCKLERSTSCTGGASKMNGGSAGIGAAAAQQMKKEAENPHIRRGIKGFVEFPKVVKAAHQGSPKEGGGRVLSLDSSNFECQRAQLKNLIRHRFPAGFAGNSDNFVIM